MNLKICVIETDNMGIWWYKHGLNSSVMFYILDLLDGCEWKFNNMTNNLLTPIQWNKKNWTRQFWTVIIMGFFVQFEYKDIITMITKFTN